MAQMPESIVRVELDIPFAVVTPYGHTENESGKSLESLITAAFHTGDVVAVHIVIEGTGVRRGICTFIDPTSQYKHECGTVFTANGVCPRAADHSDKMNKQLELEEAE